jgi:hypothetical protein
VVVFVMPPRKRPSKSIPAGSELVPVQVKGQSHQLYLLQKLLNNKRATRHPAKLTGLGDILNPWFDKTVQRPGEKLDGVADLWLQIVPKKIADHSRILSFNRGTLTVALEHATVKNELEMLLRKGLLRQLQISSKGAVFRVKTSIDGSPPKTWK